MILPAILLLAWVALPNQRYGSNPPLPEQRYGPKDAGQAIKANVEGACIRTTQSAACVGRARAPYDVLGCLELYPERAQRVSDGATIRPTQPHVYPFNPCCGYRLRTFYTELY